MYTQYELKNGLRCLVVRIPNTHSITVFKGYNVGSRQEYEGVYGGAHFVEHMMFKGTTKRPTSKAISKELERVGAHYNAYTDKDITAYYIKVAKEHLHLALDVVSDMTYNSTFPQEEFEKEKGVIIEEIKMYEDAPQQYVDDLFEQVAFQEGELGRDIIGTRESITEMNLNELVGYRNAFYSDLNAGLVLVGNIPENIEEILNTYFNQKAEQVQQPILTSYDTSQEGLRIKMQIKPVEQVHLMMGFRCRGYTSTDMYAYTLLTTLLGAGMSSPLFDEVREKRGLCYYIHMYPDVYDTVGSLVIRAGVNKEKVSEAITAIMQVLATYKEKGFTEEEIEDAKNQIIGNIALSMEDTARHAEMYVKRLVVTDEVVSPDERIRKIQEVTKDDIMRVYEESFKKHLLSIALITDQEQHEKIIDEIIL